MDCLSVVAEPAGWSARLERAQLHEAASGRQSGRPPALEPACRGRPPRAQRSALRSSHASLMVDEPRRTTT